MRVIRTAVIAGLFFASSVTSTVLGASPGPVVRDQYWPANSDGVYNSGFTFPEGVVSDVTIDGFLDHIDIPISLRFPNSTGVLNWYIFDAQNNKPMGTQPRVSGFIPNTDVDGLVTISLSTYGLLYHPGDQFTFAIEGSGGGNYLWRSYRGSGAKLHREYRLFSNGWSLDDPPLNSSGYVPGYSTYISIPESSTLALSLGIFAPLAAYRRRRG
jgi:hypothetical protein